MIINNPNNRSVGVEIGQLSTLDILNNISVNFSFYPIYS
jgi:hypothetical protein